MFQILLANSKSVCVFKSKILNFVHVYKNSSVSEKKFSKFKKNLIVTQKGSNFRDSENVSDFKFLFTYSKIVCASKFVRNFFKICSQDSKHVRHLKNCSFFQICLGFFKIVLCFKICSQDFQKMLLL